MNREIITENGEINLLLPQLIMEGLLAGEKCRYFLALLTSAIKHAQKQNGGNDHLDDLRIRSDIKSEQYDSVICGSSLSPSGEYDIPYFEEIQKDLFQSIRTMVCPFIPETVNSNPELIVRAESLISSFVQDGSRLLADDPRIALLHEEYEGETFVHLIRTIEDHLLPLREALVPEEAYGCITYLAGPEDMYLIRSFMVGLNRTEKLRCDHPGLKTTAIRAAESLLIQIEITMTGYHFLILSITGLSVKIRYVDPHLSRMSFFQDCLNPYPVFWEKITSRSHLHGKQTNHYHIISGAFSARSLEDLLMFISHLSSHMVFLIEWNRAKNVLKKIIPEKEAVKVLRKAMKRGVGHRAFLISGGEKLIYEAAKHFPGFSFRENDNLVDVLGPDHAIEFCVHVLEISYRHVTRRLSPAYLREDVRAELVRQYHHFSDDIHQQLYTHIHSIKKILTLFSSLTSDICQGNYSGRGLTEKEVQQNSADINRNIDQMFRSIRNKPEDIWSRSFFQLNRILELINDAGYLYTLIPGEKFAPDSIRDMVQVYEDSCTLADIVMSALNETNLISIRYEPADKEMKHISATMTQIILTTDEIIRSMYRKKLLMAISTVNIISHMI